MQDYHVILKIYGFTLPRSIIISTDLNEYWLYPDIYIQKIHNLDTQISLHEKGIIKYYEIKSGSFRKNSESFSYVIKKMELDLSQDTKTLINSIWIGFKAIIFGLDFIFSKLHDINDCYIFEENYNFCRKIQINKIEHKFYYQFSSIELDKHFHDFEAFLSSFINQFEKFSKYNSDIELFIRGKTIWNLKTITPRKSSRDPLDSLSDLWESLEHVSNNYWINRKKKLTEIRKRYFPNLKSNKNIRKVPKIKCMLEEIKFALSNEDENLIKGIYKHYYNYKKHETSDYNISRFSDLTNELMKFILLLDRIFLNIYKIYPQLVNIKSINEKIHLIFPSDIFLTDIEPIYGLKDSKKDLMQHPEYTDLLQFIEFENLNEQILDSFSNYGEMYLHNSIIKTEIISLSRKLCHFKIKNQEDVKYLYRDIKILFKNYEIKCSHLINLTYFDISKEVLEVKFKPSYIDIQIL